MKKAMFLILILCFEEAIAQVGVEEFDTNINPGVEIRTIQRQKKLIGTTYLFDNWTVGNINMNTGGTLSDIPIKYNILGQELELLKNKSLLGIKLNFVKDFNLLTSDGTYLDFIVTKEWTLDGVPGSGVYQKLSEIGNFGLVKITKVYFVKANYYVALDAGSKDDKYEKREELYFINNSTKVLVKVPNGKKKISQYFNNPEITSFIKSSKLDLKSEAGLVQLIDHANSTNDSD